MRTVVVIGFAIGAFAACGSGEPESVTPQIDPPAAPGGAGDPDAEGDTGPDRVKQNEEKAIEILHAIDEAQSGARYDDAIDRDGNGSGEYGYLAELAGLVPVRGKVGKRIGKTYLTRNLGRIRSTGSSGVVIYAGYCFAMFLPDETGHFIPEAASGGAGGALPDATRSEELWCCYAWPFVVGKTGQRVFCIDQTGDIVYYENDEPDLRITGRKHTISSQIARIAFRGETMDSGLARNALGLNDTRWTWLP